MSHGLYAFWMVVLVLLMLARDYFVQEETPLRENVCGQFQRNSCIVINKL